MERWCQIRDDNGDLEGTVKSGKLCVRNCNEDVQLELLLKVNGHV